MIACTLLSRLLDASVRKGVSSLVDTHVAVVDPLPIFQEGIAAALSSAGYTVVAPHDVLAWVQRPGSSVVLLTVRAEPDWETLGRLRESAGQHRVIAVLDDASAVAGARAVRAGAASVISRDSTIQRLRHAVDATCDGQSVMPAEVAATLAHGAQADLWVPSADQLSWLRRLATGSTVEQLATDAGYSERAMYRLLKGLYHDMDVRTRLEAIMSAQRRGWV
jgi:DNA-binding NarL/FixJ family response regulator